MPDGAAEAGSNAGLVARFELFLFAELFRCANGCIEERSLPPSERRVARGSMDSTPIRLKKSAMQLLLIFMSNGASVASEGL